MRIWTHGHDPVHPLLAWLPLGLAAAALVVDLIAASGAADLLRVGTVLVAVSLGAIGLAFVWGLVEALPRDRRRPGVLHELALAIMAAGMLGMSLWGRFYLLPGSPIPSVAVMMALPVLAIAVGVGRGVRHPQPAPSD